MKFINVLTKKKLINVAKPIIINGRSVLGLSLTNTTNNGTACWAEKKISLGTTSQYFHDFFVLTLGMKETLQAQAARWYRTKRSCPDRHDRNRFSIQPNYQLRASSTAKA